MTVTENSIRGAKDYEAVLTPVRKQFDESSVIKEVLSEDADQILVELFIVYWSTLTSGMLGPVPGHLCLAAERCQEMKLAETAHYFYNQFEHVKSHDGWATEQTYRLIDHWNRHRKIRILDAEELFSHRHNLAVQKFQEMQEDIIYSDTPFAELAVCEEMDRMERRFGTKALIQGAKKTGFHFLWETGFLKELINFKLHHSNDPLVAMDRLLAQHPEYLNRMVQAAKSTLNAYTEILNECLDLAQQKTLWVTAASLR